MVMSVADQISALNKKIIGLKALIRGSSTDHNLYALLGNQVIFGCKITEGFSSTDLILALEEDSSNINPDKQIPSERTEHYPNIANIYGRAFLTDNINSSIVDTESLVLNDAPGTVDTARHDIIYIYVSNMGPGIGILQGTASADCKNAFDTSGLETGQYPATYDSMSLPAGCVPIARVYIQYGDTGIANSRIADLRPFATRLSIQSDLGYTPEDVSKKRSTWQGIPDDTHYPSEKLVKDTFDAIEIGYTPEDVANKRTTWQETPTHTAYPSEKLVKDTFDAIEIGYTPEDVANKITVWGTPTDTQYPSAKLVSDTVKPSGVSMSLSNGTKPGAGEVLTVIAPWSITFPTNTPNSKYYASHTPSQSVTVVVSKNGAQFGTISVSGEGTTATFSITQTSFVAGDRLSFQFPATQDSTWAGVVILFAGGRVL